MSWASCSPLQFYEMNSLILSRVSLTGSYARSRGEGVVGGKTAVQRQNILKLSVLGTGLVPSGSWLSETSHSGFKMSMDETPIDYNVPKIGWKVKLDHVFEERRNQNIKPRWHQVRQLFPLAVRQVTNKYLRFAIVNHLIHSCP